MVISEEIKNKLSSLQGAVFDVDGTILESMKVWEQVTTKFYELNGLTLSHDESTLFQGMTMEESMPYIKNKYNLNMSTDDMVKKFKELIKEEYELNIKAKPGVIQYIKKLHNNGIKLAVATSGYAEFCQAAFLRLGIADCFSSYSLSSEVGANKSNPDVYLLAAARINVSPEKCIVFEDIPAGIEGAKKGGFITCAIYDDTNAQYSDILKRNADIYINSWYELM